jgi:hypothetical protein
MKYRIALLLFIAASSLVSPWHIKAQHDLTLYQLGNVPQRIYQNPAFIPKQHAYFGIPGISGIQATYAVPFTYNDVLTRESDDSLKFEVETFISKLSKNEYFRINSNVDIISVGSGISRDRFYINFSIRERMTQSTMIPQNLANLLWYGNHAPAVFGQSVNISPTINVVAYDEYGFSFSGYALKKKLTYGIRLKYLAGRFNINTKRAEFDFYTDPSTFNLNMKSDVELQTSGIDDIENYLDQPLQTLILPGNNGFSVDLGATWQINDKFAVNASLLDLGYINWRKDNLSMVSHNPGNEFQFNGLNMSDFVEMFNDPAKFGQKVEDSLRKLVQIDSIYDEPYIDWLPLRFNAGGSYLINEHHRFNVLFEGISWAKQFHPALSLSYNYNYRKWLELTLSYNIYNRQYTNFGAGISVNAGPVQFYFLSDNIPGLIYYKGTNNYSFQVGINVLLGRNSTSQPVPEEIIVPEEKTQE